MSGRFCIYSFRLKSSFEDVISLTDGSTSIFPAIFKLDQETLKFHPVKRSFNSGKTELGPIRVRVILCVSYLIHLGLFYIVVLSLCAHLPMVLFLIVCLEYWFQPLCVAS